MHQPTVEIPDDWVSITRRLRKYATSASVRDIILMDESHAIYIQFPADPTQDLEPHEYLIASLADSSAGDLSAREMITFICWRSLLSKGYKLRDFAVEDVGDGNPTTNDYQCVFPAADLSCMFVKRERGAVAEEEQAHVQQNTKAAKNTGSGNYLVVFNSRSLGQDITLQLIPKMGNGGGRLGESTTVGNGLDPRSVPELPSAHRRQFQPPHTTPGSNVSGCNTPTIHLLIERIITKHVAVLSAITDNGSSSPPQRFLAKLFSTNVSRTLLAKELSVYHACASLQGAEIPFFYGTWRITDPPSESIILLTELITPGTTISDLCDTAQESPDEHEQALLKSRLDWLRDGAEKAVDALHRHNVTHNDTRGRNMVLAIDGGVERVVIVDFDVAQVHTDPERVRCKAWEDKTFMRNAFRV